MAYRWKQWSFEFPPGLADRSVLTFEDGRGLQLSVTSDALDGGPETLEAYVSTQLQTLQDSIPGYQLLNRESRKVKDLPAVAIDQSARAPDGVPSQQHQLYLAVGQEVLIVTGTIRAAGLDRARDAVDALVKTLEVQSKG